MGKVVMLCRNVEAAELVAEQIRKETEGEVIVHRCDLASLKSVRECAEQLSNSLEKIVNVSSLAHEQGVMQWDDLNWNTTPYSPIKAYSQSKLANVLFTKELARRGEGSGVTVYSLHPGVIA